jgi:hypothetical protein
MERHRRLRQEIELVEEVVSRQAFLVFRTSRKKEVRGAERVPEWAPSLFLGLTGQNPRSGYFAVSASSPYVGYGSGCVLVGMAVRVTKSACTCAHCAGSFLVVMGASGFA